MPQRVSQLRPWQRPSRLAVHELRRNNIGDACRRDESLENRPFFALGKKEFPYEWAATARDVSKYEARQTTEAPVNAVSTAYEFGSVLCSTASSFLVIGVVKSQLLCQLS